MKYNMEDLKKQKMERIAEAKRLRKQMKKKMIEDIQNGTAIEPIIIIEDTPNGPVYHKFKHNIRIMQNFEQLDP